MAERSVVVRIRAEIADFRRDMAAAGEAARRTARDAEESGTRASSAMGRLMQSAQQNEQSWAKAGTALLGFGAAAIAGVGLAIAKYAEFDKAMSEVQASTHETAGNMQLLREAAIEAGADTAFSAKEAAQGIDELAKAGVSTKDILNGGLTGALSLAAAGGQSVGDAAETAATALTQFKLAGKDIPHVADLLAAGAGKAQGSVSDMGMALKQAGLVASQTGLSIEETTGGLAAFASAGLVGSDAGTSFKSMLQRLTPQSKEAKAKMDELGISAYDAQGNFVGLEKFAGNLKTSMVDLTPEARNAAMAVIFGSDAVRAASVIYDNGAGGVRGWIDAVDEAGFAAQTAAIKQDNLAGDLEKLGGSFDTVLIQGGSGAAEALRGVVQSAEGLVDMLGSLDPKVLSVGVTMLGAVGGVALLAGTFLKVVPAVASTVTSFRTLGTEGSRVPGTLGKIGKAAGGLAIALAALSVVGAIFSESTTKSAEDYGQALLGVAGAGKAASAANLDEVFSGFTKHMGIDIVTSANSAEEAIHKLTHQDFGDSLIKGIEPITGLLNLPKGQATQLETRLKDLGAAMGDLVKNGGAETAAKSFNVLSTEFEKNGKSAQQALDMMPAYRDALKGVGVAAGLSLEPQELLELAAGKIPPRLAAVTTAQERNTIVAQAQARATEESAKKLEEMGLTVDGTIHSLDKLLQAMFATGLAQLSVKDATGAWHETLRGLDVEVNKVRASQTETNRILNEGATDFDLTSAAGYAASGIFGEVAQKGQSMTEAMAKNGATQGELQGSLKSTYDGLIATAGKFDITGTAADDLARAALGIPKDVPIETAIQNFADTMVKLAQVKTGVENIPKDPHVNVSVELSGLQEAVRLANQIGSVKTQLGTNINGDSSGIGGGYATGGLVGFATGGHVGGFPTGGLLRGPGTGTSDSILARVSNGEYIIPQKRVAQYGIGFFEDIRAGAYAPAKSMAGGYGAAMSVSGGYSARSAGSGLDAAALDRLTEAVRSARQINVAQLSTTEATTMAVTRAMGYI